MKNIISLLALLLPGCNMHNYASIVQCKTNAERDAALIFVSALPAAAAMPATIAVGVGAAAGGTYYAMHTASCKKY